MGDDPWYIFKRMVQVGSMRHVIEQGERTPYPTIIEEPNLRDVLESMRLPEYMPLLVSIPLGAVVAYGTTFGLFHLPVLRKELFGYMYAAFVGTSFWLGMKGAYYKLVGFENNGLQWKFPEQRLKKYRFIGELETDSYAMLLKRKDVDSSKEY